MTDCSTMLPVRTDQTLQICGYPLHDISQNLLDKLPPQVVFNEYGVQVSFDLKFAALWQTVIEKYTSEFCIHTA